MVGENDGGVGAGPQWERSGEVSIGCTMRTDKWACCRRYNIFWKGVTSHLVERSSGAGAGSSELMGGGDRSLSAVVGLVENWVCVGGGSTGK